MNKNELKPTDILVPVDKYISLLKDQEKLRRLEAGGVDNWYWYTDSLYPKGEQQFDEFCDDLDEKYGKTK